MPDSWRIQTLLDNRSQKSLPSASSGTGATVIRSERSLEKPVLFAKGETQRILSLLGEPTKLNPELLEAIEYNKSYPLWIVSPSDMGLHSVLLIDATSGSKTLKSGYKGIDKVEDLKLVTLYQKLNSDNLETFIATTDIWTNEYIASSMKILKNGVILEDITNEDDSFSGSILSDIETNIFDSSAGQVQITFADDFDILDTDEISVSLDLNLSSYYCMLTTVGAGSSYVQTMVDSEGDGTFKLNFKNKNSYGVYNTNNSSPVEFSIVSGATNGFGQVIDANNVFDNDDFFVAHTEGGAGFTTFTDGNSYIALTGGTRNISDLNVTVGYSFFKKFRTYSANIFFDCTLDDNVSAMFKELRDGYQKYSRYLIGMPNADEATTLETSLSVQDRGFGYFWGWFKITNPYSKKGNVVNIPMGEVAKNYADSWTLAYGGLSVAWINENGVGGQLTSGRYISSVYDPSEADLKAMDEARINPIIYDPSYGAMIVSRRTSVAEFSDYSFSDYSMIIDYILSNVVSSVLPYQIVKMNDTIHRNIVRTKTESIIQPLTVAPLSVLDSYLIKCDSENNNDEVKAREEFRLDIVIKVTPKSRSIVLTFINTPQTSTVDEMLDY